ncbi:hypothetical protein L3X38_019631 [Prunus dulcis]|uniref:RNase H type-1 domain-containing protein n=1 Tax=Prunus dulcis TaxID=3755 RepID=A0AAD4ZB88_PRUDU|nr:hypothetical protein L3X38_019631 [Prunus dulcis]
MHQPGTTFTMDDNSGGMFMGGFAACKIANSVLEAEAHAALASLSLAAEMGLANVVIESDSQVLMNCARGKIRKGIWSIYPILSAIKRCCNNFIFCDWRWISRRANRAVAAIARRTKCDKVWLDRPPSSLVFVLQSDGLPCPPC